MTSINTGYAFGSVLVPFVQTAPKAGPMEVTVVVVMDMTISRGNSGIPTAGSATPASRESRLIESEVTSRPNPCVALHSASSVFRSEFAVKRAWDTRV